MTGISLVSALDIRYACLYNNVCLSFDFGSMFEVVNTLLQAQYHMTSRLHFVMRVRAKESLLVLYNLGYFMSHDPIIRR